MCFTALGLARKNTPGILWPAILCDLAFLAAIPAGRRFATSKIAPDDFSVRLRPYGCSASRRSACKVLKGASTTKLRASQAGTLPPGSECTW
jgi:hypothetical protein